MVGKSFSRRRKSGGRASFTLGRAHADDQTKPNRLAPDDDETAGIGLAVSADHAPDQTALSPDQRLQRAVDAAGGQDRLVEIERFSRSSFLPEPERTRLRDRQASFRHAIEHGPADEAFASLGDMDKRYTQALGPKATAPESLDPRATKNSPYLTWERVSADMRRPEYVRGDPDLHQAIQGKLRISALPGYRQIDRIEPAAGGAPSLSGLAPERFAVNLPDRPKGPIPHIADLAHPLTELRGPRTGPARGFRADAGSPRRR